MVQRSWVQIPLIEVEVLQPHDAREVQIPHFVQEEVAHKLLVVGLLEVQISLVAREVRIPLVALEVQIPLAVLEVVQKPLFALGVLRMLLSQLEVGQIPPDAPEVD